MSDRLFRRAKNFLRRAIAVGGFGTNRPGSLKWECGWKAEVIRQILEINRGDFIDVGANIGQTLLDFNAAGIGSRYIGFEPNPASFVSLFTLVEKNNFKKCLILPVGLSDTTTILNLHSLIDAPTDLTASLVSDLRPARKHKQTPVLCCRFDDVRDNLGVISIGLIKIDVEGFELAVLRGMERKPLRVAGSHPL